LLNAEYTQQILSEIQTEAKSARSLAQACGASRATVYRRLNGLREAGLVDTGLAYDTDGHHRTVFESTLESVTLDVTPDGLSVSVTTYPSDSR
jgi:response regulator of citrate/malate metabolism